MKMDFFCKQCIAALPVLAVALTTSCNDQDFDFDKMHSQNAEYNYEQNFAKIFGDIDPNQKWDFSGNEKLANTRAVYDDIKIEAIKGIDFSINNSYKNQKINSTIGQNSNLKKAVEEALPDKEEKKGALMTFVAPDNAFAIYPISAQGAYTYDMYVKVGDEDEVKVFTKTWGVYDKPYINGMAYSYNSSTKKFSTASMPGVYVEAPIGTPIAIYIKNIKDNGNVVTNSNGVAVGTGTGNVISVDALNNIIPTGLDSRVWQEGKSKIKYVGLEDSYAKNADENNSHASGDKDFNDLCLLMVGWPEVPDVVIIDNDEYTVKTTIGKRYMVEDMGYSDSESQAVSDYTDIDFNDIVVDFEKTTITKYKVEIINGTPGVPQIQNGYPKYNTTAKVRALGGTWDFVLKVGDTPVFQKSKAGHDDDPYALDFNGGYSINEVSTTELYADRIYNTSLNYFRADGNFITDKNIYIVELKEPAIQNWVPADNNISFNLIDNDHPADWNIDNLLTSEDDNGNVYKVGFPAMGACPKIVAWDLDKVWQTERTPVTKEWFPTTEQKTETNKRE